MGTTGTTHCRSHRVWWACLALVVLLAGCGQLVARATGDAAEESLGDTVVFNALPTVSKCRAETGQRCLTANQLRERHGLDRLASDGFTGKGVTIAVIDVSGAQTFAEDLEEYSSRMGLPPPRLRVRDIELGYGRPVGYDQSDPDAVRAATQTTRRVQLLHAFAPQAKILLERLRFPAEGKVRRSVDELIAIRIRSLVNEGEADVILLGGGISERAMSRRTEAVDEELRNRQLTFGDAARRGITVVASGGPRPSWPAVDPGVLAVGGTTGESRVFDRPAYQVNLATVDDGDRERRTVPDVRMPPLRDAGVLTYQSVSPRPGWMLTEPTQAERFAGLVVLAAQRSGGGGIGAIHDDLYALASESADRRGNGLRVAEDDNGRPTGRTVANADRFVRALAESAPKPERAVLDARPKPQKRCGKGPPVEIGLPDHQNVAMKPRLCVRYDPVADTVTGQVVLSWRSPESDDNNPGGTRGRLDRLGIHVELEHGDRGVERRQCSASSQVNHSKQGRQVCEVRVESPASGSWRVDGLLRWKGAGRDASRTPLHDSPQLRAGRG